MVPNQNNTPKTDTASFPQSFMLYLHDLVIVVAALMILFTLFFRMVIVSGPSMNHTLLDGDWLLVKTGILYTNPKHGDVIIASKESFNDGEPIVKRIIATEHQTVDIDFDAGIVYVDGIALDEPYIAAATKLQEGMEFPLVVEENCIFVMGDNRMNSRDSRSPDIGLIDRREVLGKAIFLVYPGTGGGVFSRDFSRMGVIG